MDSARSKGLLFTILALTSLCHAQTFDPVRKLATGQIGHVKYSVGDIDNKGVFEARLKKEFWGEDTIEIEMEGVSGEPATVGKRVIIPWSGRGSMEWIEDGDFLRWKMKFPVDPGFTTYQMKLTGWEQYDFLYQTPFPSPAEYIKNGEVWLRQETLPGDYATDHRRRKAIDGGYAVVHKTKRDNQYGMGVAFYIMRPKLTDATGKVIWSQIDVTDGVYTVTFPSDVFENAQYPVIINDTFGETDPSGYSNAQVTADWWVGDYAAPSGGDGTCDSIAVYCYENVGGRVGFTTGIYNNDAPITLLANGTTEAKNIPQGAAAWETFTFGTSPSVTNAVTYVFSMHMGGSGRFHYITENPGTRGAYDTGEAYSSGSMPTNFTVDGTDYNRKIAIYVNYTPSAGGPTGAQVIVIGN